VESVNKDSVDIIIQSEPIKINLKIGESKKVDVNGDNIYDIEIKLNSITEKIPDIFIKKIDIPKDKEKKEVEGNNTESIEIENNKTEEKTNNLKEINKSEIENNVTKLDKTNDSLNESCVENWNCGEWSTCIDKIKTRTCNDLNDCGTIETLPDENASCESEIPLSENCGDDLKNLISVSGTCDLASASVTTSFDLFGIEQTTTNYYEIKGVEENKCIFYLKIQQNDIDYSEELTQQMIDSGITQEEINQQEQESKNQANSLVGRDGTCKISPSNLTIFLNKMCGGEISGGISCSIGTNSSDCTYSGDWEFFNSCEGNYFSTTL